MGIDIKSPEVEVRESRLGSITGFAGTAGELCDSYKKANYATEEEVLANASGAAREMHFVSWL